MQVQDTSYDEAKVMAEAIFAEDKDRVITADQHPEIVQGFAKEILANLEAEDSE